MPRKQEKKRQRFWGWVIGRQPRRDAPPTEPAVSREQAEAEPAEQSPPAPAQTQAPAETEAPAERPCAVCGGTSFRWGWLESGLYGIGEGPPAARQPKYVRRKTRFGDFLGLRARICQDCGCVELFARRQQDR